MFILSSKPRKVTTWSSTEWPISPLNLGTCFRYPSRNFAKMWGRTKEAYLACTMGWKSVVEGAVWGDWVDNKEEEEDDEDEGEEEESVGVLCVKERKKEDTSMKISKGF